jgi:hypothetical protein
LVIDPVEDTELRICSLVVAKVCQPNLGYNHFVRRNRLFRLFKMRNDGQHVRVTATFEAYIPECLAALTRLAIYMLPQKLDALLKARVGYTSVTTHVVVRALVHEQIGRSFTHVGYASLHESQV